MPTVAINLKIPIKTITIIGCDVVSAMLAYELSKGDLDVTVVGANAQPAMVATGSALGWQLLVLGHGVIWASYVWLA